MPHPVFTPELLAQTITYPSYYTLSEKMVAEGRTTGPDQSQEMLDYSKLNFQRMKRLTANPAALLPEVIAAVEALPVKLLWVVFTEPWCGDAAQSLPILAHIAAESGGRIELQILFRDEHPDAMAHYLTNGGKAIPKVVCLRADTHEELFTWGPRPANSQAIMDDYKANPAGRSKEEIITVLHKWYADNKTVDVQREIAARLANVN